MHKPSNIFGFGLMTGFAFTIALIALTAVVAPDDIARMGLELAENRTNNIISFVVFTVVGLVPLLLEMRRKPR